MSNNIPFVHEGDLSYAQEQMAKHKAIRKSMRDGTYHDISQDYDESDGVKRLNQKSHKYHSSSLSIVVDTFCSHCFEPTKVKRATIKAAARKGRGVCCTKCRGKMWRNGKDKSND